MSDFDRRFTRAGAAAVADTSVDAGLRAFMLGVYQKLALGLLLSGALAYLFSNQLAPLVYTFSGDRIVGLTGLGFGLRLAPLGVLFGAMFFMRNPTPQSAAMLYWTIVSLLGAGLSVWFVTAGLGSAATVFLITAAAFGGLSLYGYTTKRDLTAMGSFMVMGLFGIIIASLVNMFLHSEMMQFIVSILGVLIFSGLTAWDTQRLKMTYYSLGGNQAGLGVATSYGALTLYLDFINLFQFLMALFGGGNRR